MYKEVRKGKYTIVFEKSPFETDYKISVMYDDVLIMVEAEEFLGTEYTFKFTKSVLKKDDIDTLVRIQHGRKARNKFYVMKKLIDPLFSR